MNAEPNTNDLAGDKGAASGPPPIAAKKALSRRRKWIFRCLLLLLLLGFFELLSYAAIPLFNRGLQEKIRRTDDIFEEQSDMIRQLLDRDVEQLHEIHPVLGWRYAPNYRAGPHQLNAAALRSTREYAKVPPPGALRVATFGDSFVYGSEVDNADAWPALVEQANPDLEVLNYGVPGYGTDQAYLRYRLEGRDYAPHVVLIGFPPSDLGRAVNVYRRFYSTEDPPLFKPRFVLDADGELSLLECPVRGRGDYERLLECPRDVVALGRHDQWFEPAVYKNGLHDYSAAVRLASAAAYRLRRRFDPDRLTRGGVFNTDSAAYKIQCKLFEEFAKLARERGAQPLVVFLPDKSVVRARQEGGPAVYGPLVEHLKTRQIDCLDGADAFAGAAGDPDTGRWFAPGGHYSPEGNRVVAAWLAGELRKHSPGRAK